MKLTLVAKLTVVSKLRPQAGSEGQKLNKVILKDLVEMEKMLKSASKILFLARDIIF